ncbi:hypothetical protein I3843_03G011400 [Carya illinoinensis]|nr:hypothetical protein I3843_03G011400 [Carya illinoinensis]
MVIGLIFRDCNGEILAALHEQRQGIYRSNAADCMALWRLDHIIEDTNKVFNYYIDWSIVFTYREGNRVAHKLANMALCNHEVSHCWVEEGPTAIMSLVLTDKLCSVVSADM